MSQVGYTPISLYYSTTASAAPTAGNLVAGELAINTNDGILYYKDSSGVVQKMATKGSAVIGGSNTQVQYNSSGSLAGSANFTFNGTTVTIANDASISGLTVGKGGGAVSTNTVVGANALASANTGDKNTVVGNNALNANTSGYLQTAIGTSALFSNTTGNQNTAVGGQALYVNTTGSNSVSVGTYSLLSNTTGGANTALGTQALQANTTASNNTAVGYQAGYSNTTGTENIFVGVQAGKNLTTGSNCTYIGINIIPSSVSVNNEMVISAGGGGATGKGAATGFINPGGAGMYQGNNSTLWSITSDQRLKKNIVDNIDGLNKITAIKVRNFEYRLPEEVTELDQSSAINIKGVQLGAIAQELKEVLPDCVKTESTGVMSVDASNITWYLVNAIKELKAEVDSLKQQLGK